MRYRSAFETLILCQLPDNHSFQGYSLLTFPSLVGVPHSASHCSPSHVSPPHCEKCESVTFRISLSGGSGTFLPQLTGLFVSYISLTCGSSITLSPPPNMWVCHTVRNVGQPHFGFSFSVSPPFASLCNHSFQTYQNPVNSGS